MDIVFETQLFKSDVHFVAIGCAWLPLVVVLAGRVPSDTCGIAVDRCQHVYSNRTSFRTYRSMLVLEVMIAFVYENL